MRVKCASIASIARRDLKIHRRDQKAPANRSRRFVQKFGFGERR
jgi:hypothetical protein